MKSNWEFVLDLVNRHTVISELRGGYPWMSVTGDVLDVHHPEGGDEGNGYDPRLHFNNKYFIETYVSLYQQINKAK